MGQGILVRRGATRALTRHSVPWMPSRRLRLVLPTALATLAVATAFGTSAGPAAAATPPDAIGYQDQSFAPTSGSITGTKP
jgi:hypothetical protein